MVPAQFTLDSVDIQQGLKLGYWEQFKLFGGFQLRRTAKGKALFATFVGEGGFLSDQVTIDNHAAYITTTAKTKRKLIDITGITDAPGFVSGGQGTAKVVEFTWNWDVDLLPKELRDFYGKMTPARRSAFLRLYDDGWRFQNFQ